VAEQALVSQLAEETDSKPVQCGFESHRGHHEPPVKRQALDRLAAAVVIIGGFEVKDAVGVDWRNIETIAEDLAKGSTKQRLQPPGSKGRAAQEALVAPVQNWPPFGPTDWLPWMRDTRNGMTHRAGGRKMMVPTTDNSLLGCFIGSRAGVSCNRWSSALGPPKARSGTRSSARPATMC
jgi:hypothetical protein